MTIPARSDGPIRISGLVIGRRLCPAGAGAARRLPRARAGDADPPLARTDPLRPVPPRPRSSSTSRSCASRASMQNSIPSRSGAGFLAHARSAPGRRRPAGSGRPSRWRGSPCRHRRWRPRDVCPRRQRGRHRDRRRRRLGRPGAARGFASSGRRLGRGGDRGRGSPAVPGRDGLGPGRGAGGLVRLTVRRAPAAAGQRNRLRSRGHRAGTGGSARWGHPAHGRRQRYRPAPAPRR